MKIPFLNLDISNSTTLKSLQKQVSVLEGNLYGMRPTIDWLEQVTNDSGIKVPFYPRPVQTLYELVNYSDVLRTVHRAYKTETFRQGIAVVEKFSKKCVKCGKEFEENEIKECDECGGITRKPDFAQRKTLEDFKNKHVNENKQYLLDVLKQAESDILTLDDAFILMTKDYVITDGVITGSKIKEIIRANPTIMRIIADKTGRPAHDNQGNKIVTCPEHRREVHKNIEVCPICGMKMYQAYYVAVNEQGKEDTYYIDGEIIHFSRYSPSLTYGFPPVLSIWVKVITLMNEDNYINKSYGLQRPPKGLLAVSTSNMASLKTMWKEYLDAALENPHMIQPFAIESDGNKGRFIEYIDLMKSLPEMQFIEQRNEYRRAIGALYGVQPLFQADISTSGGLNNEGLQVTVTNRAVDMAHDDYNTRVLPDIVDELAITDWKLELEPNEEKDEMAELQREGQKIQNAQMMRNLGFEVERDEKGNFKFSDKPSLPPQNETSLMGQDGFGTNRPEPMSSSPKPSFSGEPEKIGNEGAEKELKKKVDLVKGKVYIKPDQTAPEGVSVQTGAYGGRYYETSNNPSVPDSKPNDSKPVDSTEGLAPPEVTISISKNIDDAEKKIKEESDPIIGLPSNVKARIYEDSFREHLKDLFIDEPKIAEDMYTISEISGFMQGWVESSASPSSTFMRNVVHEKLFAPMTWIDHKSRADPNFNDELRSSITHALTEYFTIEGGEDKLRTVLEKSIISRYLFTQEYLKRKYKDKKTITLYRGITVHATKNDVIEEGEKTALINSLESWTSERYNAEIFAKKSKRNEGEGAIITSEVPIEKIFEMHDISTKMTGFSEHEFVVIGHKAKVKVERYTGETD